MKGFWGEVTGKKFLVGQFDVSRIAVRKTDRDHSSNHKLAVCGQPQQTGTFSFINIFAKILFAVKDPTANLRVRSTAVWGTPDLTSSISKSHNYPGVCNSCFLTVIFAYFLFYVKNYLDITEMRLTRHCKALMFYFTILL